MNIVCNDVPDLGIVAFADGADRPEQVDDLRLAGQAVVDVLLAPLGDEFVSFMTRDIPPAPPQAAELRAINSGKSAAAA